MNLCEMKRECIREIRDRRLLEDEAELVIKCGTVPRICKRRKRLLANKEDSELDTSLLRGVGPMPMIDELRKCGVKPYNLTAEEFDKYYANLYNVLALEGQVSREDIWFLVKDVILMYQLRQAGYET